MNLEMSSSPTTSLLGKAPFSFSGQDPLFEEFLALLLEQSKDFSLNGKGELYSSVVCEPTGKSGRQLGRKALIDRLLKSLSSSVTWSFFLGEAANVECDSRIEAEGRSKESDVTSPGLFEFQSEPGERQPLFKSSRRRSTKVQFSELSESLQSEILPQAFEEYFARAPLSLSRHFLLKILRFEKDLRLLAPSLRDQSDYSSAESTIRSIFAEFSTNFYITVDPPATGSSGVLNRAAELMGECLDRESAESSKSGQSGSEGARVTSALSGLFALFSEKDRTASEIVEHSLPHFRSLAREITPMLLEGQRNTNSSDILESWTPLIHIVQSNEFEITVLEALREWIERLPYALKGAVARVSEKERTDFEKRYRILKRTVNDAHENVLRRDELVQPWHGKFPCKRLVSTATRELTNWICASPLLSAFLSGAFVVVNSGDERVLCLNPVFLAKKQSMSLKRALEKSETPLTEPAVDSGAASQPTETEQSLQRAGTSATLRRTVLNDLRSGTVHVDELMQIWRTTGDHFHSYST